MADRMPDARAIPAIEAFTPASSVAGSLPIERDDRNRI